MSSSWPPHDLALTACRTDEVAKIMRRVAKQYDGEAYINRIASDVGKLPEGCRTAGGRSLSRFKAAATSQHSRSRLGV